MATIKKYLKYNIFVLRIMSLWTDENFSKSKYRYYHLTVYIFIVGTFNILQTIYFLKAFDDLELFATSASPTLICVMVNIKAFCYIRNFDTIQNLTRQLDQPQFQPKNKRQEEQAWLFARIYLFAYFAYLAAAVLILLLWAATPILVNPEARNLPYLLWYPYDVTKPIYYEISFIHQTIALIYVVGGNVNMDFFTCGLMTYIGIECDCLSDTLENLDEFAKVKDDHKIREDEMNKTLITYGVKHYLNILKFAKECESYIKYSIFIQFAASLIAIGATMFQLTVMSPTSVEFVTTLVYQLGILYELFIYCWFGNEVIYKSNNITNGLYNCNWVDCSPKFRRNLQFIIQRSQQPIKLCAVDFFVVSIPTFTSIMRMTYSAFALLRQAHNK